MPSLPTLRAVPAALLLLLLATLLPPPAAAHQRLLRTEPARDAVTHTAPRALRLVFHQAVEPNFTRIELLGPDGAAVALGEPRVAADSAMVLLTPIVGALRAGAYTVRWSTASRDGHPVHGEYTFSIADGAAGLAVDQGDGGGSGSGSEPVGERTAPAGAAALVPQQPAPSAAGAAEFGAESPAYVVVRWVTYLALLGAIGAVAFALLVLGVLRRGGVADQEELIALAGKRAAVVGLGFVLLLLAGAAARLYAQSLALHGAEAALDPEQLAAMLARTEWGWGWLLQVGGALAAGIGFALARRGRAGGWMLAGSAVLALAVTPALSGHAAAIDGGTGVLAIGADWLHVLAAGGWLGSLLALLAAGIPAALHLGPERRGAAVGALVGAFSPLALLCAALLVLTGATATVIHSGSVAALLGSRYGALLGIKLGVVLLVALSGAYNFLRVKPVLGDDGGTVRLQRSARFELGVGAAVLLVTALLVATARPDADATDPAAGTLTAAASRAE